jgi:prevent-host-death family protein
MVMIMVNINEAKAKLSEFLEAAARGERVMICNRNQPVAELRAVAPASATERRLGRAAGRMVIPPSFFEPLPADLLDAFEGKHAGAGISRVAEEKPRYTPGKGPGPRRRR